jgi:hypothetical protein
MTRAMISAIVVATLIVVGSSLLRSRPPSLELSAAAMPPLEELHTMAVVSKLLVQEVEDQSLIYATVEKR